MKSKKTDLSVKNLVTYAWKTMLAHPAVLLGATALYIAFNTHHPGFLLVHPRMGGFGMMSGVALVLIVSAIISIIVFAGLVKLFLMVHDGESPNVAEVLMHRDIFWKFVFTEVMVALIIMIGLILFFIPGIIFAIKLNFAGYAVIDKKLGPTDAIKYSWKITTGKKWFVLKMLLAIIGINIVASFANVGGLLIGLCLTLLIALRAYRTLSGTASEA